MLLHASKQSRAKAATLMGLCSKKARRSWPGSERNQFIHDTACVRPPAYVTAIMTRPAVCASLRDLANASFFSWMLGIYVLR